MSYIVFDLEFNQDLPSIQDSFQTIARAPFEIIQIGAIKLDSNLHTISTFNRFVKPTIYAHISPFITELTRITTEQLQEEQRYPEVLHAYLDFIGEQDAILCIWGMSDIVELYRNATLHQLDCSKLPTNFINLQPQASLHFGYPSKTLLRLEATVDILDLPINQPFHDAFNDATYTMEIFKKIYHSSLQSQTFHPNYVPIKPRQPKKVINFTKLIAQFEKMYLRSMTEEEQALIQLAYRMGKTGQFLEVATQKE